MRSTKTAGALVLIIACVCAVGASSSDAYAPAGATEDSLLTYFPIPATTPGYVSPLLAKEIAVLTREGMSYARAIQAIAVQGRIEQADLPRKLQASMGRAYAGVWFNGAAAQLHIGVTSRASRQKAERIAARANLADSVNITPVRSTMAQLLATQKQWNHKLTKLFARDEVKTGLEPQRNAVSVTLSSSVPPSQLAQLRREAASAGVNVFVTTVAGALRLVPLAKTECNNFVRNEAYCNKSITPGVTIKNAAGICTAGPEAIPTANKAERVLLTAGHCIAPGGEGSEWKALNRKAEEGLIGKARKFSFGSAAVGGAKGDFGEILIEAPPGGAWQTGIANNPVFAVSAEWKKKEETSYPVKGERAPTVGNVSCHEGQTSGESCGKITQLNVTLKASNVYIEGLVEVVGTKEAEKELLGEGGDSGGPWLFIETSNEVLMEGTHVGIVPECINRGKVEEGPQFFATQTECVSSGEYAEKAGNKGEWERKEYKCAKVAKVEKGVRFYKTEAECIKNEKAGEGEWERTPEHHLLFNPLKQPVGGAAPGSLEVLKLELLTTANERILPTFLLAEWLVGGTAVTTELLTETTSELLLEDTKVPLLGKAALLCSFILDGWVGPSSLDWISEILTLSGVAVSTTALSGTAVTCTNQENCEEPLVWAVNLGWETELELMEDSGTFFIDLIKPHSGGGSPGWEIECMKSIIGTVTDECTAAEAGAELALEGTTLLGNFSAAFTELAGIKLANCTMGGTETGVVEGGGSFAVSGGGELTASSESAVS